MMVLLSLPLITLVFIILILRLTKHIHILLILLLLSILLLLLELILLHVTSTLDIWVKTVDLIKVEILTLVEHAIVTALVAGLSKTCLLAGIKQSLIGLVVSTTAKAQIISEHAT